jgi:sulfite exporter TauE/SafE
MNPSEFSVVLAFGFVSSLHCVQMCGPIVLTYSVAANTGSARRSLLGLHLSYNAGRTLTYMLLGAIVGLAGGTIGFLGRIAGIENLAAIVAGMAMIVAGLTLFGMRSGIKAWRGLAMPGRMLRPIGKLMSSRSAGSKFLLGLLMGFLPCGLVYAALMRAIGTATPLGGALTLLAFGLGTSLALVVVGLGSSAATQKLVRWGTTVSTLTVLVMGALLIARGAMAGPVMHCHMQNVSSK